MANAVEISHVARHYQLALAMRLGCALPELVPVRGQRPHCGAAACDARHDEFGFHPGACRAGNRWGLWTARHDAYQAMLVHVLRILGCAAISCSVGAGNWFGAAGVRAGSRGYQRADVVMAHYFGPGRHMFLDSGNWRRTIRIGFLEQVPLCRRLPRATRPLREAYRFRPLCRG